jgi:hypothetical protein
MKAILTWLQEGCDPGVKIMNEHGVAIRTYNLLVISLEDVLRKHNLTENDVVDEMW